MLTKSNSIDTGAGPLILNVKPVEKLNLEKEKWQELPIKFFDEVRCPTEACNSDVEISGPSVSVHAAVVNAP